MYTFVTSFPKKFEKDYGIPFLNSIVDKWKPNDFRVVVYLEGYKDQEVNLPQADYIEFRHIENIEARNNFIERNKDKNGRIAEAPYNYRLDATRFSNKVYAYSDLALELIEDKYQGWLAWLDADTITKKMFGAEDAAKIMTEEVDIVHLGRIDIDYSETGFTAWNMAYHNAVSHIIDIRGAYDTDEVFCYREWHDAFIFTRLLKVYEAHGTRARNLSEGVRGLEVFSNCMLNEFFTHNKGNKKWKQKPQKLPAAQRYEKLLALVKHFSKNKLSYSIVETGTWNGKRAIQMALAAFENVDSVHYRGFDLFEEATAETDSKELNIKKHFNDKEVEAALEEFARRMKEKGKTFTYRLFKGDTNKTMKGHRFDDVDFAFIDGGHSYETVCNDYEHLKETPIIVFDDYYTQEEGEVSEEHRGVIQCFEDIDSEYKRIIPSQDKTALGPYVHLAVVTKEDEELPKEVTRLPIVVKPQESMPSDYIKDNIRTNIPLLKKFDWVQSYKPTDKHSIVVSGGEIDFEKLREVQKENDADIWCVKHAYPRLLKEGIVADYCVVLDPRPIDGLSTHGIKRKDLFEDINPDTTFVVASMTDTSVVKYILDKTDNVLGFHAITGSIRDNNIKDKFVVDPSLNIKEDTIFISNGTASATRTLGLLETLGRKNIHMFGFDCCVSKDIAEKEKDVKDEKGQNKFIHVETGGIEFWTTGELLALAQDLEKMFEKKGLSINIKFYEGSSPSLASQVFNQSYYNLNFKTFEEAVGGVS